MAESTTGRTVPKYRQIADSYAAQIEAGKLVPGDQLPSQADLQHEFGAAMGTVVRGLQELRDRGLVRTEHGAGTFVIARRPPATGVAEQLAEARETIGQLMRRVADVECQVEELRANAGMDPWLPLPESAADDGELRAG